MKVTKPVLVGVFRTGLFEDKVIVEKLLICMYVWMDRYIKYYAVRFLGLENI